MTDQIFTMTIEFAKIFDHTKYKLKDTGEEISYEEYKSGNFEGEVEVDTSGRGQYADIDRGDAKSQQKWLRELAKNPETKFNAYFNSEEDMQKLLDSETFENETTNPQTGGKSTRIKDGNPELGIGKYIQLKRKLSDIKEFVDRKTGDLKEFEAGGLLNVTVYDEEKDAFVPYDYETLGAPANGSVAKVRFNDKYMRPMNLGFVEVIEFTEGESEGVDF